MSLDDLLRQMQEDEAQDGLDLAREDPQTVMLTPINYAKARGIAPQRVYAAFRNRKLQRERCPCGRTTVNIEASDTYFGFSKEVNGDNDGSSSL